MAGFFAELKRRNVFRVAIAYLAIGWLVLQVAGLVIPAFDIPSWVLRLLVIVVGLGFPVALVISWVFELTPEGLKREADVESGQSIARLTGRKLDVIIIGVLAAVVGLLLLDRFVLTPRTAVTPATSAAVVPVAPAAEAVPAVPARSIAVLPFVDMSQAKDQEYFSDGLSETLLDMLAQVPDLKVAARTSSFAFKGKPQDVRGIGAALGVAHLLEGSVQKAGDQVRITAQLVQASDGTHLWSKHFDRQLADVFKIQDEIATEVVGALQIALGKAAQQHLTQKRTENVEAYQEYLKGIALLPRRKVAEMREAAAHFERAIVLDPTFAKAYVGASDVYRLLGYYGSRSDEERARIRPHLDRALELAPELGEAHASLGGVFLFAGNATDAEREFLRAIALTPSYAPAYLGYGGLLRNELGRYEEALVLHQRAAALDPLSPVLQLNLALSLQATGRLSEAQAVLAKLVLDQPQYASAYRIQAGIAAEQGDLVGALRAMREHDARDPDAIPKALDRCDMLRQFGATPEADRCVAEFVRRAPGQPSVLQAQALQRSTAGDLGAALTLLDRAGDSALWTRAWVLVRLDRAAEALTVYRKLAPQLLASPAPALNITQADRALDVGAALLRTGAQSQGRALIKSALPLLATRQPGPFFSTVPPWRVVLGHELLGEREQAFAALERRVAGGDFIGLYLLDADPLLADLRADPRYERILAPARAKAAEQVRLARETGLL